MSTSMVAAPQAGLQTGPRAGEAGRELARAAAIAGGILSFSALALGSIQFCKFSAAALGPGAFMFSIVKNLGGALAPFLTAAGATGAVLGLSAAWLQRDRVSNPRRLGFGASAVVLAGLAAAAVNAVYTQQILSVRGDFAAAFGADWQDRIPAQLQDGLLPQRWTWSFPAAADVRVEHDLAFATVPGSDRQLLADVYSPPAGVAPSGVGFVYLHGGGYSAFDLFLPEVSPAAQTAMYDVDRFLALLASDTFERKP